MENDKMNDDYKICCVTGHRPKGFPWNYYRRDDERQQRYLASLRRGIVKLIKEDGYNYFITGCAIGADLDFAEICIELRDTEFPDIFIEGAIPCDRQAMMWSAADKERYARVLEKLNLTHYVSHGYYSACFQKRNEYMVDKSQLVIAVWNANEKGGTWNTIKYARKNKKKIKYVLLGLYSNSDRQLEKAFVRLFEQDAAEKKDLLWQRICERLEQSEKEENGGDA